MSNILTREQEEEQLLLMFHAQQPRLKDKIEHVMLLQTVIRKTLDVKYDLRPRMEKVKDKDAAEYRRYYSLILKMEDSIGRDLGRLGLTLTPQKYIPVAEKANFDPKALNTIKEKTKNLSEALQ